jgi:hypothetical protein
MNKPIFVILPNTNNEVVNLSLTKSIKKEESHMCDEFGISFDNKPWKTKSKNERDAFYDFILKQLNDNNNLKCFRKELYNIAEKIKKDIDIYDLDILKEIRNRTNTYERGNPGKYYLKNLLEKCVVINDYENLDEISIKVSGDFRSFFWKFIIPNLPKGFQATAVYPMDNENFLNIFKIYKIKNDYIYF